MALISRTYGPATADPVATGSAVLAAHVNTDLDTVYSEINGGLDDDNIAAGADIAGSKLALDSDSFNVAGDVKPLFIGFSAYLSANTNYNNNETVIFDTENFDTGSDYAIATGIFVAPVAGYYFFGAQLRFDAPEAKESVGVSITKAGTTFVLANANAATVDDEFSVNAVKVIHCDAADQIYVLCQESGGGTITVVGANGYSHFFGYLIAKD